MQCAEKGENAAEREWHFRQSGGISALRAVQLMEWTLLNEVDTLGRQHTVGGAVVSENAIFFALTHHLLWLQ